jgi:hypothetical protein
MRLNLIFATVVLFTSASAMAADAAYWDQAVRDPGTIALAQRTLRAEGYDPGPVNGQVGPQTVEAVKQAQKDRELEPSGRLDRRTIAALGIDTESAAAGGSDRLAQSELRGSCDLLIGPEKERCLQQGGTVEASAKAK